MRHNIGRSNKQDKRTKQNNKGKYNQVKIKKLNMQIQNEDKKIGEEINARKEVQRDNSKETKYKQDKGTL